MFLTLSTTTAVELSCFVFGIITLYRDNSPLWRSTLLFLFLVCLTEIIIGRWAAIKFHNNIFVYNIFNLFEAGIISFGIYQCLKKYTHSKLYVISGLVLFCAIYLAFALNYGMMTYNTWAASALAAIFVLHCLHYYYLVITAEEILEINKSPEFWWMTTILFFYFGSTTGNLFHELFSSIMIGKYSIRHHLFLILNVIFYCLWPYSFICRYKQRRLQH